MPTKVLLTLFYPLLLLAWLVNRLSCQDPLRLQPPADERSGWIELNVQSDIVSYFRESLSSDRQSGASAASPLIFLLRLIARLYPSRKLPLPQAKDVAAVDWERKIPDEVYTLW